MKLKSACLLFIFAAQAHAAAEFVRADLSSMNSNARKSDNIQGFVGGMSNQLSDDIGNVPGNRYSGSVFFDYHNRPSSYSDSLESRFTFAGMINDQSLLMYSLQEAYIAKRVAADDEFKMGRQILNWSPVDAIWGFGKLNNRRNFDYFEPGQEGLIGFQYTARSANGWRLSAFYSPIYVPELNPSLDIDDKKKTITSKHAWTTAPERKATIEVGRPQAPIRYNVDAPGINEVIFRHSGGMNIGFDTKHVSTDFFWMRKPENQISAMADVRVDTIQNVVNADVTPQFYYHDVYGSSMRYHNKDLQMYVSAIAIRPNTYPDGDETATLLTEIPTEKRREDYAGGGISKTNDLYSYGLNYVARLSPYDRKLDRLAVDPRWNQAINVFASRNFGKHYSLLGDLKYDMLTTDRLLMVRGIYNATRSLQLSVGVNMIGTPVDGKSFWSPYTNNDSVYGGLRMIF